MNKYSILFLISFVFFRLTGQSLTEITGYAPAYVGKEMEIYQISDFISMREERIASSTVKADSTFSLVFELDETRKLILKCANNKANLFANPGGKYEVLLPEKSKYDPYNPSGNFVELTFFNLGKNDINYKILEFNDFLDEADAVLQELDMEGEFQVASFHPEFQFADTEPDDITNFTNRSPYPTLHLLREESIDRAVEAFPEAEMIYETNIATMEKLGAEGWKKLDVGPSP